MPEIPRVNQNLRLRQLTCQRHGLILARNIDHNHQIKTP